MSIVTSIQPRYADGSTFLDITRQDFLLDTNPSTNPRRYEEDARIEQEEEDIKLDKDSRTFTPQLPEFSSLLASSFTRVYKDIYEV